MTHEEIIALAKEAGLPYLPTPNSALVRIVTKAVLIEREACAKVADATFRGKPGQSVNLAVANAIRARGVA